MTEEEKIIATLEKREAELWSAIQAEVGNSTVDLISELIEVNIELEEISNR